MLQAEVDLNYILDASEDRIVEAINRRVEVARQWCADNNIAFTPLLDPQPRQPAAPVSLSFTEEMRGYVSPGETDYDAGSRKGQINNSAFMVHLTIATDNVARPVPDPQQEASVTGCVRSDAFGGERPVLEGAFNLLVDARDPNRKAMYYRLYFADGKNRPLTLLGFKDVHSGGVSG